MTHLASMLLLITVVLVAARSSPAAHAVDLHRRRLPLYNYCNGSHWIGRFCRNPGSGGNGYWIDLCWHLPLFSRYSAQLEPSEIASWHDALSSGVVELGREIEPLWFVLEIINKKRLPHHLGMSHMEYGACPRGTSCRQLIDENYDAHISCIRMYWGTQKPTYLIPHINEEGVWGYIDVVKRAILFRHTLFDEGPFPVVYIVAEEDNRSEQDGHHNTLVKVQWFPRADLTDVSFTAMLVDQHNDLLSTASGLSAHLTDGAMDVPLLPPGQGLPDDPDLLCASNSVLDVGQRPDQICEPLRTVDVKAGNSISMYFDLATTNLKPDDVATLYFGLQHYNAKVAP